MTSVARSDTSDGVGSAWFAAGGRVGRRRTFTYWSVTAVVAGECLIGGAFDVLRLPPFFPVLRHLGYPGYLSVILGFAKLLAAVAILAPRRPRLKEWAYAGIVINMLGAAASHLAAGDPVTAVIAPLTFAGLAFWSWGTRPPSRTLPPPS